MAKVICIDIDGTLTKEVCWCPNQCLEAEPNQEMIDKVNSLGHVYWVILYTARADELIPATLKWLRQNSVRYHAISNNKIPTDVGYVDDKNISIEDFVSGEFNRKRQVYIPGGY